MKKDKSDRRSGRQTPEGKTGYPVPELPDWRSFFHSIPQPMMILDLNYTVTAVNQATLKVTGKTENDIIGRKCYEFFHEDDRPPSGCPVEMTVCGGSSPPTEIEVEAYSRTFLVSCT